MRCSPTEERWHHIAIVPQRPTYLIDSLRQCFRTRLPVTCLISVYANYIGPSVMTDANSEGFPICDERITENDRCVIKIIGIHCDLGPSYTADIPRITVSTPCVIKLLKDLNPSKATGPDSIPGKLLNPLAFKPAVTARKKSAVICSNRPYPPVRTCCTFVLIYK